MRLVNQFGYGRKNRLYLLVYGDTDLDLGMVIQIILYVYVHFFSKDMVG